MCVGRDGGGGGDNRSKYGRGDVSEGDSVKDKNET